ncbi:MAG: hypothetical protein ACT6QS_18120 [Flavobacteriales bacterium]
MKTLLTIACSLIIGLQSYAQAESQPGTWALIKSQNGVNIYAKEEICTVAPTNVQIKYKLLKFENTTANVKNVSFRYNLYYGSTTCATCQNSEYDQHFVLAPNQVREASCSNSDDALKVFIRYESERNYSPDLSQMDFGNLIIN